MSTDYGNQGTTTVGHPQVRSFTAFEVLCAECGQEWGEDNDYGTPIYRSEQEALSSVVEHWGMVQRDDGRLYCSSCETERVRTECAARGHSWGPWDGRSSNVRICDECKSVEFRKVTT